jgi:hypothetical protein
MHNQIGLDQIRHHQISIWHIALFSALFRTFPSLLNSSGQMSARNPVSSELARNMDKPSISIGFSKWLLRDTIRRTYHVQALISRSMASG